MKEHRISAGAYVTSRSARPKRSARSARSALRAPEPNTPDINSLQAAQTGHPRRDWGHACYHDRRVLQIARFLEGVRGEVTVNGDHTHRSATSKVLERG